MSIQKAFGDSVRFFRLETGLSQEKFALQIGMDRTYFASVEEGKRNISIQNIHKIVDGFNLSLSVFFEKVDYYVRESDGSKGLSCNLNF